VPWPGQGGAFKGTRVSHAGLQGAPLGASTILAASLGMNPAHDLPGLPVRFSREALCAQLHQAAALRERALQPGRACTGAAVRTGLALGSTCLSGSQPASRVLLPEQSRAPGACRPCRICIRERVCIITKKAASEARQCKSDRMAEPQVVVAQQVVRFSAYRMQTLQCRMQQCPRTGTQAECRSRRYPGSYGRQHMMAVSS
jgi:hypothetical protein